jgi:hypothetical protein
VHFIQLRNCRECEEGIGYYSECEEGFDFDTNTNSCGLIEEVQCSDYDDDDDYDDTPPTTPSNECPTNRPWEVVYFSSPNCNEYFICMNGYRMKMTCMVGFAWNEEEKQCDYPMFSRCSDRY